MSARSGLWWGVGGLAVAALIVVPLIVDDDDESADGFDGYIQSGTCAAPSDELMVELESQDTGSDVGPYVALGADGQPVTLGYYGAPGVPSLGLAAIYTDHLFSMVITDPNTDSAVACGDILQPAADQFDEAGLAVVQLLPVESSGVEGVAAIERARLQKELVVTPTRARIILSTDAADSPVDVADGYDGYVQSGQCASPQEDVRVELASRGDFDVLPFDAVSSEAGDSVTVAYYGAPGVPGFGLAAAYAGLSFSVVIADADSGEPVACGDILEPNADAYVDAGIALVQLLPTGDAGVRGYALVDRATMQRELDVTPALIRILLFAPPVTDA
jgi:hypothetical protein